MMGFRKKQIKPIKFLYSLVFVYKIKVRWVINYIWIWHIRNALIWGMQYMSSVEIRNNLLEFVIDWRELWGGEGVKKRK